MGWYNNILGMVGFVKTSATEGKNFWDRLDGEDEVARLVAERKAVPRDATQAPPCNRHRTEAPATACPGVEGRICTYEPDEHVAPPCNTGAPPCRKSPRCTKARADARSR